MGGTNPFSASGLFSGGSFPSTQLFLKSHHYVSHIDASVQGKEKQIRCPFHDVVTMSPALALSPTVSALQPSRRENMPNFGDLGARPGGQIEKNGPTKRVVSALAVQAGAKKGKRLSAVVQNVDAAPLVSMEVMNNNFEEWMKLATDNVSFLCLSFRRLHELEILANGPS